MISLKEVLLIHRKSIERYGGADGIRDKSALFSAIERPFQTFDGQDLYPGIYEKVAALIESILINHPFVDGNKRTGFALLMLTLQNEGFLLNADDNSLYQFVINIASGEMRYEQIRVWLENNTTTKLD